MTEAYERTIVVAASLAEAWSAFVDERKREAWLRRPSAVPDVFEAGEVQVGKVEVERLLTWSQRQEGLPGWYQTEVRFEPVAGGTRIRLTRSGFGDGEAWAHYAAGTAKGWDEMLADLALYLESGVSAGRHSALRSSIAATVLPTHAGPRVTHVIPGGFAEAAGLRAGDLLVRLDGVPLLNGATLDALCRVHAPGAEVEAEWVRARELQRSRARLSPFGFGAGEWVGFPGHYPKPALAASE